MKNHSLPSYRAPTELDSAWKISLTLRGKDSCID